MNSEETGGKERAVLDGNDQHHQQDQPPLSQLSIEPETTTSTTMLAVDDSITAKQSDEASVDEENASISLDDDTNDRNNSMQNVETSIDEKNPGICIDNDPLSQLPIEPETTTSTTMLAVDDSITAKESDEASVDGENASISLDDDTNDRNNSMQNVETSIDEKNPGIGIDNDTSERSERTRSVNERTPRSGRRRRRHLSKNDDNNDDDTKTKEKSKQILRKESNVSENRSEHAVKKFDSLVEGINSERNSNQPLEFKTPEIEHSEKQNLEHLDNMSSDVDGINRPGAICVKGTDGDWKYRDDNLSFSLTGSRAFSWHHSKHKQNFAGNDSKQKFMGHDSKQKFMGHSSKMNFLGNQSKPIIAHRVSESEQFERRNCSVYVAERMSRYRPYQPTRCGPFRKGCLLGFFLASIIIVAYISIDIARSRKRHSPTVSPTGTIPNSFNESVLTSIKDRGFIRCRASTTDVESEKGFSLDLCRALAAAVFDDTDGAIDRAKFVELPFGEQFGAIWDGRLDVSTSLTTYNMQREVLESLTGKNMAFSVPFIYSGMVFEGIPSYVDCANRQDTLRGICRSLSVCILKDSTHVDNVNKLLPGIMTHEIPSYNDEFFDTFVNGTCNVIAADQLDIKAHESRVRALGYDGEYSSGIRLHTYEALALTSRGDDQEWSDFCTWVLQALIRAEALNITQEVALSSSSWSRATSSLGDRYPETASVFGEDHANMFRSVIAAVGHYGELYERHLESILPRNSTGNINTLNFGDSGLLLSYPFGMLTMDTIALTSSNFATLGPVSGGTLESIVDRGVLRCGVIANQTVFANFQGEEYNGNQSGTVEQNNAVWTGLDVEYCRAVSTAIFPDDLSNINKHDDRVMFVEVGFSEEDGYVALDNNEIDVFAGGSMTLTRDVKELKTGKGFTFTPPYFFYYDNEIQSTIASNYIGSNDMGIGRSLVTRETDPQWSSFVRWITNAIIYAEKHEILQDDAQDLPVVGLFGAKYEQMFRDAIFAVGNYGEIFKRTLEEPYNIARFGRNLINFNKGPHFVQIPWL